MDEREIVRRAAEGLTPPEPSLDRLLQRRDRVQRNRRIRAGVLGIAVAIAVGWLGVVAIRSTPTVPADRSEGLGIFAPVADRIVYLNEADGGDLGYGAGLWAVDPSGPSETTKGPRVADDVASTLVPLGREDATPVGWSSDGTELLLKRTVGDSLFPKEYLYIVHADGSETQLNSEPMYFAEHSATISPDGERVVFAAQGDHLGLYVVDTAGGQPAPLPYPSYGLVGSPTFSPDGSQIAYLVYGDFPAGNPHEEHVWVANADGSGAHEILADDETVVGGSTGLQWSPAGDRLAVGTNLNGGADAIYTFAPDGSDFTRVINGGISPYWSPDGTQIAYTILCDDQTDGCTAGLAIADADGSNVRAFGFAASGPWHPAPPG